MLLPLLSCARAKVAVAVAVALFHTPRLRGLSKWLAPDRWNEVIGLQHIKVCVFDDNVLISGANLSNDYFTNRQDRYLLVERCSSLADYVHNVVSTLSTFSLQLRSDGSRALHPSWSDHPFKGSQSEFEAKAKERMEAVLKSCDSNKTACEGDTLIAPLLQLGTLGIKQDEEFTKELLMRAEADSRIVMATGYFNLTDEYKNVLFNLMSAPISIVMASPKVNGFYGARGFAGAIPTVYTYLARQFHGEILARGQSDRVLLFEYERKNWTFHAKGLWLFPPGEENPSLTLIGSPNFGYRSVYRDLELQFALVTTNRDLRNRLRKEQEDIMKFVIPVTSSTFAAPDRAVPMWVRFFVDHCKDFF